MLDAVLLFVPGVYVFFLTASFWLHLSLLCKVHCALSSETTSNTRCISQYIRLGEVSSTGNWNYLYRSLEHTIWYIILYEFLLLFQNNYVQMQILYIVSRYSQQVSFWYKIAIFHIQLGQSLRATPSNFPANNIFDSWYGSRVTDGQNFHSIYHACTVKINN